MENIVNYTIQIIRLVVDTSDGATYPRRVVAVPVLISRPLANGAGSVSVRFVFDLRDLPQGEPYIMFEDLEESAVLAWLDNPLLAQQHVQARELADRAAEESILQLQIGDLTPPWVDDPTTPIVAPPAPLPIDVSTSATDQSQLLTMPETSGLVQLIRAVVLDVLQQQQQQQP